MTEHPEITTVFDDDAGEVVGWIQQNEVGSEITKDKLFMVSANPNITKDFENSDNAFEHQKFLTELPERFGAAAQWWQMKYIPYFSDELHH
jgi:hypothetical protein